MLYKDTTMMPFSWLVPNNQPTKLTTWISNILPSSNGLKLILLLVNFPTNDNYANTFTKPLGCQLFHQHYDTFPASLLSDLFHNSRCHQHTMWVLGIIWPTVAGFVAMHKVSKLPRRRRSRCHCQCLYVGAMVQGGHSMLH